MSSFTTINPATAEKLETYQLMDTQEVDRAISNCHMAFEHWRGADLDHRAEVIRGIGRGLTESKDELAQMMTCEMGKLLSQSHQEIELCAAICEWTANHGPAHLAREEHQINAGTGHIVHAPIGVIYGIQPWNYPAYQVVRYSIANLMAGNSVLLKHAQNVTGSGLLLASIFEAAGLPENLFTTLVIDHEESDRVIEHDLVRGVTLTGSPDAGRAVGATAARALKKTVLELGSNDAYLVLADADIEQAVKLCVQGRIYNNGETCIAAKRFVVVDDVYEEFKAAFVNAMNNVSLGSPESDEVDLGPMAREDLRDKLHEQVSESVAKGATIMCGGEIPDRKGFYYPATVLADVSPGQPAYDDELFGPVAALIRAADTDDALRIANDSRFGLGGGIISGDTASAVELAATQFDTGMVFVNAFGLAQPDMPFGGVKDSGYGREHGGYGMREFTNTKAIIVE